MRKTIGDNFVGSEIYDIQYQGVQETLKKALQLVGEEKGPVTELYRNSRYNDEPLLFQYTSVIKKPLGLPDDEYHKHNLAGGISFVKENAVMKALGEGIERYCLATYERRHLIYSSAEDLKDQALDIPSIVAFSDAQLQDKRYKRFRYKKNLKYWWVEGFSILRRRKIMVPAQLVYVPYHYSREGSIIRFPISTGAASATSLGMAIFRGICEIVERDAFVIFYLNKLTPPIINLFNTKDKFLSVISESFRRYNLELFIFDITTDLPVISIMAIIVDRSGVGIAISVGLKSSLNAREAIIGAIEEAQHIRPWIRDNKYDTGIKDEKSGSDGLDLLRRGLCWSEIHKIRDINFFLASKKIIHVDSFIPKRIKRLNVGLKDLINELNKRRLETILIDVTQPEVRKKGFFVVKTLIPELQPLYLMEDFKYLGGERLYKIPGILGYKNSPKKESQLNKIPHPFL